MKPAWRVEFAPFAERQLGKIAEQDRARVVRYLNDRIAVAEDPRRLGEALRGEPAGLWRYRVGDFRIVARIEDLRVTVLVLKVGNRRDIYR